MLALLAAAVLLLAAAVLLLAAAVLLLAAAILAAAARVLAAAAGAGTPLWHAQRVRFLKGPPPHKRSRGSFFVCFDEANSLLRNQHILDIGRPTIFFSRVLYSSLERSSVPPLSGRFSQVRAREGGLR